MEPLSPVLIKEFHLALNMGHIPGKSLVTGNAGIVAASLSKNYSAGLSSSISASISSAKFFARPPGAIMP
jgi:hypothetical protein